MEGTIVKFSWIDFFEELADKIRDFENDQKALIKTLIDTGYYKNGLKDIDENNEKIDLEELDPFTFLSLIVKFKTENRIEILKHLKNSLDITATIPQDFNGVPSSLPNIAWYFNYKKSRKPDDIPILWTLFKEALKNEISEEIFEKALNVPRVGFAKITQGLFRMRPKLYCPIDKQFRPFLVKHGIDISCIKSIKYSDYSHCLSDIKTKFPNEEFYKLSHRAWLENQPDNDNSSKKLNASKKYWVIAPGEHAKYWEEFTTNKIIGIGWDELIDLTLYKNKDDIQTKLKSIYGEKTSFSNNALACYNFANTMNVGDTVFVKKGIKELVGYGVITSDYRFDDEREENKHIRNVDWIKVGNWQLPEGEQFALKTLTDISKFKDFIQTLKSIVNIPTGTVKKSHEINYWWLNANPKIWDFKKHEVGQNIIYTSRNEKGNKRRVYKYFEEVKPGDLILGYIASPIKEVTGICEVIKGLHKSEAGEGVEFKKTEEFKSPISFETLKGVKELKNCEPLKNNQGSLFKISKEEYEIIGEIIDNENPSADYPKQPTYTVSDFAQETSFPSNLLRTWVNAIERKGQAVFYGPPGTGKTYIAEKLAKHIISEKDGFKDLIQFHPSYSYEDFMQGIRPISTDDGMLQYPIVPGRFMEFCKEAQKRNGPCVLIIDEINRANLSRVFGELMYLLEYRQNEIPLSSGKLFRIPDNVRIVGTMNTADRSIALVDHALRRRFAFISLSPRMEILKEFHKQTGYEVDGIINTLEKLNNEISDPHYEVGVSHFLHKNLSEQIADIWKMEIEPYLEEYFFDQSDKVEKYRWKNIQDKISH